MGERLSNSNYVDRDSDIFRIFQLTRFNHSKNSQCSRFHFCHRDICKLSTHRIVLPIDTDCLLRIGPYLTRGATVPYLRSKVLSRKIAQPGWVFKAKLLSTVLSEPNNIHIELRLNQKIG